MSFGDGWMLGPAGCPGGPGLLGGCPNGVVPPSPRGWAPVSADPDVDGGGLRQSFCRGGLQAPAVMMKATPERATRVEAPSGA